ncbi:MAG: hypothetical protein HOL27_07440, partial [Candidatus Marinimicrobia bacterium]|nr:hypothetical protein [Candidatus Neomarinimicrobiota bacterium]MBT5405771.1 hypothetical protein [Candidatus Neomarinimicrobiota bacterium]MBT6158807.1 hypothetical protein [Candidatus Neomarinimicrobiota bacterium]MBT6738022.1 hypothetical protein [Candidatus Neomarinimicrobiota bacterium]
MKQIITLIIFFQFLFAGPDIGIFEKILNASGSFEETTSAFELALGESNFTLHAKYDFNSSDIDGQNSRLYILTSPTYLKAVEN